MPMFLSFLLGLILLLSILFSLEQMGIALDESDLESFFLWTCIASVIAGLPILL